MLESDPSLVEARLPDHRWTPLHVAAAGLNIQMVTWLMQRGADVNAKGRNWTEQTPLDTAARSSNADQSAEFADVANRLLRAGAEMTRWAAVALGDADWLRARHAQGSLTNPVEGDGGMLRIAASHNRADILQLLLDLGFDPNERARMEDVDADGVAFTWGMPLYHCAQFGKYAMAEILLKHRADPNGKRMLGVMPDVEISVAAQFDGAGRRPEVARNGQAAVGSENDARPVAERDRVTLADCCRVGARGLFRHRRRRSLVRPNRDSGDRRGREDARERQ